MNAEIATTSGETEESRATPIGELPGSWRVARIGELFDIQQGKALSQAARFGPSQRPFLRTANVFWGRVDLAVVDRMHFSDEEAERLSLRPGDLLVCEGGEIGRAGLWKLPNSEYSFQNHLHRLRPKSEVVDAEFVGHWLQAAFRYLGLYVGVGNRTTIPNLSASRLKQLEVPQPPRQEQRAIAGALSKLQMRVEIQDQIVATLIKLKAATMSKLFREGLRGEPLKQTDIGQIPISWQVVALSDLFGIRYGFGQTPRLDPSGVPMIRATDIKRGRIVSTNVMRIARESIPTSRLRYLKKGDLLVVRSGAYTGDVAEYEGIWDKAIAGYDLVLSPKNDQSNSTFVAQFLMSAATRQYFRSNRDRAAQPHLNADQVGRTPVPVPPKTEQDEIARILRELARREELAAKARDRLASLFRTALLSFMSGTLRLGSQSARI